MPAVTRVGDNNTGHDACPPTALSSGSPNVNVNGIPVGRVGDPYNPHGCPAHVPHVGNIAAGAPHVFINGKAAGRIGDPVTCGGSVAVGSSNVFVGNGGGGSLTINGQSVTAQDFKCKCVGDVISCSPLCTEIDEIILATPQIAKNMSNQQEDTYSKLAWNCLSEMLQKWIVENAYVTSTEERKAGITPIHILPLEWDWFTHYSRFNVNYNSLVERALSNAGKLELVNLLKKHPAWQNGGAFDYSISEKTKWEKNYFNSIPVNRSILNLDGMDVCLATHSIRLLAKGNIEVDQGTSIRKITVSNIYAFVHDIFNFDEDSYIIDPKLGWWSKEELSFNLSKSNDSYYNLDNSKFLEFRAKYNKGGDFIVLSELHECEEFSQQIFFSE